jgi:acetylornithine deacetylase/succinyl-diaminopimelate desuccinylase-like protein
MDPNLVDRVLELAIEIQQIPAPTFDEGKRGHFIYERFLQEKLEDIEIDEIGNVLGRLPGKGNTPPVVVSAHLDTVFLPGTDLDCERQEEKIIGPGIGDNAVGLAGLLGLIWELKQHGVKLNSDLWLVANVGEEGLGDLRGMREVVNRFAGQIQAYVILEGMALGQVYHRGLGVRRFRIRANTSGGHSWVDYGKPSAVHELAQIVTRLLEIHIPEKPRTSINVGMISGGTSVNTIAGEASIELDLRSEEVEALEELVSSVTGVVQESQRPEVSVNIELIGHRPVGEISKYHPLVALAVQGLEMAGIQPSLNIGSTDANIPLSLGYPAICLGLTTGNGAHTVNEYIDLPPLEFGLDQLLFVIKGVDRL